MDVIFVFWVRKAWNVRESHRVCYYTILWICGFGEGQATALPYSLEKVN